ncbi:ubiquitin-like protein Pup [Naumannella halotolerans]|uniref:Prokaryotic ubiquitin-like protein Pup n=1 Tax=Naumannella halotolerans TaxID=993414 RepID=A0A4R7J7K8_9ACTN|nr:ubiquitin-like protein Pup [Naumannella halotolerans]TDT33440.1 ubiquitin-like protein Pup [Naumannella halotolerans]
MAESQQHSNRSKGDPGEDADSTPVAQDQPQPQTDDFDDLLDEIDGVLETNAAEFVRSFVQKGGQ